MFWNFVNSKLIKCYTRVIDDVEKAYIAIANYFAAFLLIKIHLLPCMVCLSLSG